MLLETVRVILIINKIGFFFNKFMFTTFMLLLLGIALN